MGRIESEAARMAMLVADLLLLARLDQGAAAGPWNPVDLLALAGRCGTRRPTPGCRSASSCSHRLANTTPSTVDGDEARLRQVVTNLIANALQHAPAPATHHGIGPQRTRRTDR